MPITPIVPINTTAVANSPAGAGGLTASLIPSVPSGTLNGHVMVASVYWAATDTLTPPAGWTAVAAALTETTNNLRTQMFYRVASSEPASYTWGVSSTNIWGVSITTLSGVNTTTPVHQINATNTVGGSTNPITTPSLTAGTATTVYTQIMGFQGTRENNTVLRTATSADANTTELADWGVDGGTTCRNGHVYLRTVADAPGTVTGVSITLDAISNVTSRGDWTIALTPADPSDSDSATGTETESGTVTGADSDSGTVTETEFIAVPIADTDTGTGTETENVLVVQEYIVSDNFDRVNESPLGISSSGHTWTNV